MNINRFSEGQTQSRGESAATPSWRLARWLEWRRWTRPVRAGVALAFLAGVLPSISAAGQDLRIAVIDLATITEQMPEKKDVEAKVQAEVAALDREVQDRWKELARLNQQFKSEEHALNAKALAERQEEIIRQEKELSEYWERRSSEIRRSTTDVTGVLSKLVRSSVADMAKQHGFDLVFDKENGRLLYASDSFDHTADLMEILKQRRASSSPSLSGTNSANKAASTALSPKDP